MVSAGRNPQDYLAARGRSYRLSRAGRITRGWPFSVKVPVKRYFGDKPVGKVVGKSWINFIDSPAKPCYHSDVRIVEVHRNTLKG